MTLLILYLLLAVLASFFCSLLEAVLLSASPSYLTVAANEKKRFGILLLAQKTDIDRPLAAILTLNTIAHTVGAAGVGAQVNLIYGDQMVAVASGFLTLIILIFSEIIPKTLGATHWVALAPFTAHSLRGLIFLLYPFVLLMELISKIFGGANAHKLSREEMIVNAEIGASEGTLKRKESNIIKNLLMLDNVLVEDIMTPRSVIMSLQGTMTVSEVLSQHRTLRFSRIPVFLNNTDEIEGVVHRYEILEASSRDEDSKTLESLMTPVHGIPESLSVAACLDQLISRNDHIFIVVDAYGGLTGLVTLEDAIETLLGVEIVDEFDSVADLRAYALERWQARKSKKFTMERSRNQRDSE